MFGQQGGKIEIIVIFDKMNVIVALIFGSLCSPVIYERDGWYLFPFHRVPVFHSHSYKTI